MKTNRVSFIFGAITIAIHLAGFAAVDWGTEKFLAQTVTYHDLDLSQAADAAVLYQRIGSAAEEVCERFDAGTAAHQALRERCEERAVAATVARINMAMVSAQHGTSARQRSAT